MSPVKPSQLPNVGCPACHVPSQRAPTPRPLSHFAQSVIAFDHSPLMVYRFDSAYVRSVSRTLHEYCSRWRERWECQPLPSEIPRSVSFGGGRPAYINVCVLGQFELIVVEYLVLVL